MISGEKLLSEFWQECSQHTMRMQRLGLSTDVLMIAHAATQAYEAGDMATFQARYFEACEGIQAQENIIRQRTDKEYGMYCNREHTIQSLVRDGRMDELREMLPDDNDLTSAVLVYSVRKLV